MPMISFMVCIIAFICLFLIIICYSLSLLMATSSFGLIMSLLHVIGDDSISIISYTRLSSCSFYSKLKIISCLISTFM